MIRLLWDDKCTITVKEKAQNPVSKLTEYTEVAKYTDEPCKLSYKSLVSTGDGYIASVRQSTKLFISPDVLIPPGSKLTVTHKGTTTEFSRSGLPGVYTNHQEVPLELFEGWA